MKKSAMPNPLQKPKMSGPVGNDVFSEIQKQLSALSQFVTQHDSWIHTAKARFNEQSYINDNLQRRIVVLEQPMTLSTSGFPVHHVLGPRYY